MTKFKVTFGNCGSGGTPGISVANFFSEEVEAHDWATAIMKATAVRVRGDGDYGFRNYEKDHLYIESVSTVARQEPDITIPGQYHAAIPMYVRG